MGTFAGLDWSHSMFISIGVDATGGTSYTDLVTTQLMSVPYALYSARSAATSATPSEIHDADNNTKVQTEKSANENIIRFTLNGTEKMRLRGNALELPNSGNSVYIGDSAGSATTSALSNTFVGYFSGHATTGAQNSVFIGSGAGMKTGSVNNNTFVGAFSREANTTGAENVFVGQSAGTANTTGGGNTIMGSGAGAIIPVPITLSSAPKPATRKPPVDPTHF